MVFGRIERVEELGGRVEIWISPSSPSPFSHRGEKGDKK
jgi:hypothetical protein